MTYETEIVPSVAKMKKAKKQFHMATYTKHVNRKKVTVKFWLN